MLTPHVGSATTVTRLAMANLVVDNLFAFMDGKGPIAPTPETPWPEARLLGPRFRTIVKRLTCYAA